MATYLSLAMASEVADFITQCLFAKAVITGKSECRV